MTNQEPLKGKDLLEFLDKNPDLTKQEKAIKAGYVTNTATGLEPRMVDFFMALMEARNVSFSSKSHLALKGKQLLEMINGYSKLTEEEKARKAGYVINTPSGERVDMPGFRKALAEAMDHLD